MSHHIYHTDCFVLSSDPRLRSSKIIRIFTKDFGLVAARAQAVREVKSKLRFHLQDLSRSDISLVRGKTGWQIVGARLKQNIYGELRREPEKLRVAVRVFSLLQRLLQGEEGNRSLFDVLTNGIGYLTSSKLSPTEVSTFEAVLVLRLFHNL